MISAMVCCDGFVTTRTCIQALENAYKAYKNPLKRSHTTSLSSKPIQGSNQHYLPNQTKTIKPPSKMADNNNPGNFANRPKEEVQNIAKKGGEASHSGGFASMDADKQVSNFD
jgi:general stress protein YciG